MVPRSMALMGALASAVARMKVSACGGGEEVVLVVMVMMC